MNKLISYLPILLSLLIILDVKSQEKSRETEVEIKSMNKVLRITADSSTFDEAFGDSYRVLLVFKKKLKQTKKIILPINGSPDFPYRLTQNFDGSSKFVLIEGAWHFFIYDAAKDLLSKKIRPEFQDAEGVDAQTGQLKNLKISQDGQTLTGYALDLGDFKFDLSNPAKPTQIK